MLPVDYAFTSGERNALYDALISIKSNPYSDYESFDAEVADLTTQGRVPSAFLDIAKYSRERDSVIKPYVYLQNCPIDDERPIFDFARPVASKYELKKTFVAEGFLSLFSSLTAMPIVRYGLMNNGDAYHDVYPMEQMSTSLSQKSLISLGHHQDFPIHFARPRWVNMIAIRNPRQNDVYTTYVRNYDVFEMLDSSTIKILEHPIFYTPYDDVTKHGDKKKSLDDNDGDKKAIKIGNMLMYYEGRTKAHTPEGERALKILNEAIAQRTVRIKLEDGDFISNDNETTLHGRDVAEIRDANAHKTRWLIKTHSLASISHLTDRFMPGRPGVLNG